uniref:Uncharacterized protein n=1 Tax=Siphoviridae sp. ct3z32 TaxID=2825327 RepID=A0A8S5VHJ1_9CAUD|nr:MAG TPA: hypothetical protein [Siphoviridae sp. ct3z32]
MLRIANPQSLNRLGHFLTADCKSAERLAGLKFKNKLCNLKLGTFFSALPGHRPG